MPGLLQSDESSASRLYAAIAAELVCSLLFAFFGAPGAGAAGNAVLLAVLVYVAANVSGGHINPAVTVATLVTGHISFSRGLAYIVAQCLGATVGSALHLLLVPGAECVGSFAPHGISLGQAFGWELLMTFVLVITVYSVAVGEPSFGIVGPAAIGASVYATAIVGGGFTGGALNPARVLAPAIVFGCNWGAVPIYILGELAGGVAAALVSWPLYGTGLQLGKWLDAAEHAASAGYERIAGAVHGGSAA